MRNCRQKSVGRILVVEDNKANLEITAIFLESAGYRVLRAQTAEEGIRIARDRSPDLILMDISLPSMDGLEAAEILKEDLQTQRIPILAFTAHAMIDDAAKSLRSGCMGHVTKPIERKRLLQEVGRFVAIP